MENVYIDNTSEDQSYNSSHNTDDDFDYGKVPGYNESRSSIDVVTCTIICIGLPLTLVAIYAVYSLVKENNVAPIFVINLLISDLIQFCCMIVWVVQPEGQEIYKIVFIIYSSGLWASVCFMVAIALERYLVIACPLWYRFRRTIRTSVVICVVLWVLPLVFIFTLVYSDISWETIFAVFFLLPFPLLIFFLGGTLKALSAAISVSSEEKRRIVGMLVLVLLIYMLLFLPNIIDFMTVGFAKSRFCDTLSNLSSVFVRLSPLADLFLYVFLRKRTKDNLLASVCCCRMDNNDNSSSV